MKTPPLIKNCFLTDAKDRRSFKWAVMPLAVGLLLLAHVPMLQAQVTIGPDGPQRVPPAPGQPVEPFPTAIVYRFHVTPAAAPEPRLKYVLYPRLTERKPGNAAIYWFRAMYRNPLKDPPEGSLDGDLSTYPVKEAKEYLDRNQDSIREAAEAAYREKADWDHQLLNLRGPQTIQFVIKEMQDSRSLARLLAAQVRYDITNNDLESAIEHITILMRLSEDVSESEIFISALIGNAIQSITMDTAIRPLINQPDSPNLYWALVHLPQPFFNDRRAFEVELSLPERLYPVLDPSLPSDLPDAEWTRLLLESLKTIHAVESNEELSELQWNLMFSTYCLRCDPIARRGLIKAGWNEQQVQAMPVSQAIALYQRQLYQQVSQMALSAALLPLNERHHKDRQAAEEFISDMSRATDHEEVFPFIRTIFPALAQYRIGVARGQIRVAGFTVVEAIRMHMAENNGQLPESLSDITIVPVPDNPWSCKPFDYELKDGMAVIEAPLPGLPFRFEITPQSSSQASSSDASPSK